MSNNIKLTIVSDEDSVVGYFQELPEEVKQRIFGLFTFDQVVGQVEQQLRHETGLSGWDTSGWVDGSRLRAHIIKLQGLEPEFKKDLESRIRALESTVAHYKKYHDWYFKLWHSDQSHDRDDNLWGMISRTVGWKVN
jgi:hypothetical protein